MLTIEEFGGQVATVWSEMRPGTRGLIERALESSGSTTQARNAPYDARADLELSRLLRALDERAAETSALDNVRSQQLLTVAKTCVALLQEKTQSAEIFEQLVRRAEGQQNYSQIDSLGDALSRFAPSEVCELARSQNYVVRALANESLAQFGTAILVGLLNDPVDSEIAREALHRQAFDYGSEEARRIIIAFEMAGLTEDL